MNPLPHSEKELRALNSIDVMGALVPRIETLLAIREATGDHNCWLDAQLVTEFVLDTPPLPRKILECEGMLRCQRFYEVCRAEEIDPMPKEIDRAAEPEWRYRLTYETTSQGRFDQLLAIQRAAYEFREAGFHRLHGVHTIEDWRALMRATMPDGWTGDWRLPSQEHFLGEALAPNAGCPAFWRSHEGCHPQKPCDYHAWGKACPSRVIIAVVAS